jgi:hypothetical protein
MKKITLYVEDEQKEFLQEKVGKTETISWYIRKLISRDMLRSAEHKRQARKAYPSISESEVN